MYLETPLIKICGLFLFYKQTLTPMLLKIKIAEEYVLIIVRHLSKYVNRKVCKSSTKYYKNTLVSGAQGQAHTCQHSSTFFFLKKTLICSNQANLPVSLTLVLDAPLLLDVGSCLFLSIY